MSIQKEPFRTFPNIESILETEDEKKIRDPDGLPIVDIPPETADNIQINNSNNFTSEQVLLESTRLVIEEEYILPELIDSTSEEPSASEEPSSNIINKNNSIVHFDPNITIIKNDDDIIPNEIEENVENNFFINFLYEIYSNINSCYK